MKINENIYGKTTVMPTKMMKTTMKNTKNNHDETTLMPTTMMTTAMKMMKTAMVTQQ